MTNKIAQVHAKQVRGRMRIIGKAMTPRGQAFIKELEDLQVADLSDERFKSEARAAVAKMFNESLAPR